MLLAALELVAVRKQCEDGVTPVMLRLSDVAALVVSEALNVCVNGPSLKLLLEI